MKNTQNETKYKIGCLGYFIAYLIATVLWEIAAGIVGVFIMVNFENFDNTEIKWIGRLICLPILLFGWKKGKKVAVKMKLGKEINESKPPAPTNPE